MGQLARATQGQSMQRASAGDGIQRLLDKNWAKIQAVMPKHMSSERLFQLAVSSINQTPKLAECTPVSLLSCVMKCSALGLEPSNVDGLGRAYILPFWNSKSRQMEATFILGYKGMIDLARNSGQLRSIHAQAVYEGDSFSYWEDETGQHFKYQPAAKQVKSPDRLTHVYCVATLADGGMVFEVMTKDEVEDIRKRSKAKDSGPWKTDYEAMALKTVIRRSSRYLPMSTEARVAVASDETTPTYADVFQPVVAHETAQQPEYDPQEVPEGVNPTTGEIEPEIASEGVEPDLYDEDIEFGPQDA